MGAVPLDPRPATGLANECLHREVEVLGHDGTTTFARCLACDHVLIVQGGRAWTVRPLRRRPRPAAAPKV